MQKLSAKKEFQFELVVSDDGKVTLTAVRGQGLGKKRHGVIDALLPGKGTSSTFDDEPRSSAQAPGQTTSAPQKHQMQWDQPASLPPKHEIQW